MRPCPKRIFVFGAMLCFSTLASGQISKDYGPRIENTQYATSAAEASLSEMFVQGLVKSSSFLELENIKGSPYLNESFSMGKIYYKDSLMGRQLLRYNAYGDEVELKRVNVENAPLNALLKDKHIHCNILDDHIVYTSYRNDKGQTVDGYLFQIMAGNKYVLYAKKTKAFKEGKQSTNSLAQGIPSKFVEETDYYIKKHADNAIVYLPNRKGKLLRVFDVALRPRIKKYINRQRINPRGEDGLVKLIAFIDSL